MVNNIESLLSELGRATMCPNNSSYNGITEMQSSESYRIMIESLYCNAVSDLYELSDVQRGIAFKRINEVRECQEYFDVPTKETVSSLLHDYNAQPEGKRNKSLLDDYHYCQFVLECVAIQKEYLDKFASLVTVEKSQETCVNTQPDKDTVSDSNSDTSKEALKDKGWLTIDETVTLFGLSESNIESLQWRRENRFPTEDFEDKRQRKTRVLFNRKEVEEWMKTNKKKRK